MNIKSFLQAQKYKTDTAKLTFEARGRLPKEAKHGILYEIYKYKRKLYK